MNTGVRGRSEVAPMPTVARAQVSDPTSGERPFSPGLPPSYDEALQHRTVEYGYPVNHDAFYSGPPPPLPANYHLGQGIVVDGIERMPDDCESPTSGEENAENCMKMTLPPMHMCMAVTCLIFNFIIPGLGTMLAAFAVFCCTNSNEWTVGRKFGACCLNFTIGVAQLVLTPLLLLGWIWSILWGFAFVGVSSEAYHGRKRTAQTESVPNATRQGSCTLANQRTQRQQSDVRLAVRPPPVTEPQIQVQPVIHATDLQQYNLSQDDNGSNAAQGIVSSTNTTQSNTQEPEACSAPASGAASAPVVSSGQGAE